MLREQDPDNQGQQGAERTSGGSATEMGMRRFVKQAVEMWLGGLDSQRLLMTQVRTEHR